MPVFERDYSKFFCHLFFFLFFLFLFFSFFLRKKLFKNGNNENLLFKKIKFKLKKTNYKKYIFLHLNCLCDSSCNSVHVQLSNSCSLILTTHFLHALFAFSCSVEAIKSCELCLQFYLCFHLQLQLLLPFRANLLYSRSSQS